MESQKNPKSYLDVLKDLIEFIESEPGKDILTTPIAEVVQELKKEGINPQNAIDKVKSMLKESNQKFTLELAKEKRKRITEIINQWREKIKNHQKVSKEEIIKKIFGETNLQSAPAATYFRKFQDAKDEDLLSLLEDDQIIQLINEDIENHE